jgi:hypothetical protein
MTSPIEVLQAIGRAEHGKLPFFSLHRSSLPLLDAVAQEAIGQFWARSGLFSTAGDARQYLTKDFSAKRST